MDQTFWALLWTVIIVVLGVRFGNSLRDISSRLTDTNGRIDAMQQNMTLLIQAESAKLQSGMERIEGVLDARLRHVEEKLNSR